MSERRQGDTADTKHHLADKDSGCTILCIATATSSWSKCVLSRDDSATSINVSLARQGPRGCLCECGLSHAADIHQMQDDRLLGARRWYPFSENNRESIVNGPAMLSGGEMLAATLPVRTLQILDVGAPSASNAPSGCMPSVVKGVTQCN